jgi:hypothetical protein
MDNVLLLEGCSGVVKETKSKLHAIRTEAVGLHGSVWRTIGDENEIYESNRSNINPSGEGQAGQLIMYVHARTY